MEPLELLAKLSALVPAPRAHLVRYSGVLAPASKWRPLIVPEPAILSTIPPDTADATQRSRTDSTATPAATAQEALQPGPCRHGRNYTWAELMKRVWELDVLECPRCRGRMKIVAAINSPNAIQKILNCLGLPSRAPPLAAPARTFTFRSNAIPSILMYPGIVVDAWPLGRLLKRLLSSLTST